MIQKLGLLSILALQSMSNAYQDLVLAKSQEFFPQNHLEVFALPSERFKRFWYNDTKLYSLDQLSVFHEPNVEEIHIKHNKNLLIIRTYAFTKLESLKKVFITNNNQLSIIEPKFLYEVFNLELLDLTNNNLKTIGYDVLQHVGKNVRLYVGGNPFHCDCHIPTELLNRAESYNKEPLKCKSPGNMVGKSILSVHSLRRDCEPYTVTNFNDPGFLLGRRVYLLCYSAGESWGVFFE